jgi:hypothetical protein
VLLPTDPQILEAWSVVCDGSTIASAIGRIDHRTDRRPEFITAQIEYVATDENYQRRGLVAAQMAWHHDACLAAGIDVQMIGGIPFYRRFGYGYGLEDCALFLFDRASMPCPRWPTRCVGQPTPISEILRLERASPRLAGRARRAVVAASPHV